MRPQRSARALQTVAKGLRPQQQQLPSACLFVWGAVREDRYHDKSSGSSGDLPQCRVRSARAAPALAV